MAEGMAQSVEWLLPTPEVRGSTPINAPVVVKKTKTEEERGEGRSLKRFVVFLHYFLKVDQDLSTRGEVLGP